MPGRQWATWLHQALETYEVPSDLVGTLNARGEQVPARIFPVFRDEDEMGVNADLQARIERALDGSRSLVVICSPRAVESTYVAAEISYFQRLGRGDRIFAALIDGEPNGAGKMECIPAPLRAPPQARTGLFPLLAGLAADFRLGKSEGWTSPEAYRRALLEQRKMSGGALRTEVARYAAVIENLKLKLISGVLGVELGSLTKRDQAYQLRKAKKRNRILAWTGAGFALLALTAAAAAIIAWFQRGKAEMALAETNLARGAAEDLVEFMTFDLREKLEPVGRLDLMEEVNARTREYYDKYPPRAGDLVRERRRMAGSLVLGDLLLESGHSREAGATYGQALGFAKRAAQEQPNDREHFRDISIALEKIGQVALKRGQLSAAASWFERALAHRLAEVRAQSRNPVALRDLAVARLWIGDVALAQGRVREAQAAYLKSKQELEVLVAAPDRPAGAVRDLGVCLEKCARAAGLLGELTIAKAESLAAFAMWKNLAAAEPRNMVWQRGLVTAQLSVGEWAEASGNIAEAKQYYLLARGSTEAMKTADPRNAVWLRDWTACLDRLAGLSRTLQDWAEVERLYDSTTETARAHIRSDQGNSDWLSDLAVSLGNRGEARSKLGKLSGAEADLRESLQVAQGLSTRDPENMDWQRIRSVMLLKVGELALTQGKVVEAEASFREAHRLRAEAIGRTENHPNSQRDLANSAERLADVLAARGLRGEAIRLHTDALQARSRLNEAVPDDLRVLRDLAVSHERLADLETKPEDRTIHIRAAFEIAERLASLDPANPKWQAGLVGSAILLGEDAQRAERWADAQEAFSRARRTAAALVAAAPDNRDWLRNLSIVENSLGDLAFAQSDGKAAQRHYLVGLEITMRLGSGSDASLQARSDLALSYEKLGSAALMLELLDDAKQHFLTCLRIRQTVTASSSHAVWQRDLITAHAKLYLTAGRLGDEALATKHARAALELLERMNADGIELDDVLSNVYHALREVVSPEDGTRAKPGSR